MKRTLCVLCGTETECDCASWADVVMPTFRKWKACAPSLNPSTIGALIGVCREALELARRFDIRSNEEIADRVAAKYGNEAEYARAVAVAALRHRAGEDADAQR
jgi:hypothetical protein